MIVIKPNKLSLISIKRLIRWFELFGFGLMKALLYCGYKDKEYIIEVVIVTEKLLLDGFKDIKDNLGEARVSRIVIERLEAEDSLKKVLRPEED